MLRILEGGEVIVMDERDLKRLMVKPEEMILFASRLRLTALVVRNREIAKKLRIVAGWLETLANYLESDVHEGDV